MFVHIRMACVAALVGLFAGCATEMWPVKAEVPESHERFSGEMTGVTSGSGKMRLNSTNGVACQGDFVFINPSEGKGMFNCTDLRWGAFDFFFNDGRGTGIGELSGKRISFSFTRPVK